MHTPVLLKEAIEALNIKKGGKYIDATFGEGGHSREIIKRGGNVLAIEWDEENIKKKMEDRRWKVEGGKFKLVQGNFADIEKIAKENGFFPVDGILFDLGLSMEQIGRSGRGFSYKRLEEPLDMRINKKITRNAADFVNSLSAEELYEIFSRYSQEINSRAISAAIFRAARMRKILTVGDLVAIVRGGESQKRRIFQALRMAVNSELDNLTKALIGAVKIIKEGGRIAIISFHQTEDRLVKNFVRNSGLIFFNKKPIAACFGNDFERSAKLRVISI